MMKRGNTCSITSFLSIGLYGAPMKKVKLSERLRKIADYIDDSDAVADIGTDHGYMPVHLAQVNPNRCIIASDISDGSLQAARKSALIYNVSEAITFVVADGLSGVLPECIDTVVISGLGGETIVSILEKAPWTKDENMKLILQPQSKIDVLCRYLYDNAYKINETKVIRDRNKTYTILVICND